MVYFEAAKAVMFHLPRTAGQWRRGALGELGIPHEHLRVPHSHHTGTGLLEVGRSWVFVRNPVDWLRSCYSLMKYSGWPGFSSWHPLTPLNRAAAQIPGNQDPVTHCAQVMLAAPRDYITDTYLAYIHHHTEVMCFENLAKDFNAILESLGYKVDCGPLARNKKLSVMQQPDLPPGLREKIEGRNQGAMAIWEAAERGVRHVSK